MRIHANYEQVQLWRDAGALARFARADNLVAARLEPVLRQSLAKTVLDLVFRSDTGYACIPAILIDSPQLIGREMDRFVWPHVVEGALDDGAAAALESFLMPWIRSITLGKALNREVIRHFGTDADRLAFESAREARYVGAADIATSAHALAPYVYALRYAIGNTVAICGAPDGLQGAVLLSNCASVSVSDMTDADKNIGARWFPALSQREGSASLVITGPAQAAQDIATSPAVRIRLDAGAQGGERECVVAQAYPMDILFTYETLHGPATRTFALHAPQRALPARGDVPAAHAATGGSGGRVLIALRNDWERMPDADVESALELADLLRGEGLTVDVTGEPTTPDYASYDLVHCFNLIEVPSALGFLARAKQAGVRTVLTATFADVANELTWGAETAATCFRQDIDEASLARFLGFFGRRALLSPGWEERARRGPIPGYDDLVRQALALSDVVIAESERERTVLRDVFGREGDVRVIAPFIPAHRAAAAEPPVTLGEFILVHAPLEARNNQIFAVRAAREAGLPIVLCGPARDMEYAARVREAAGDTAVFVAGATRAETDWLYATAGVVLDASWYNYGSGRLWRAALSGARFCASQNGAAVDIWPAVSLIDPVTYQGVAQGIREAKALPDSERERLAKAAAPSALLRNVLAAYLALETAEIPA